MHDRPNLCVTSRLPDFFDLKIESRREIVEIGVLNLKSSAFGKDCMALSRIYRIIHDKKTLIQINEMFSIDDRWSL